MAKTYNFLYTSTSFFSCTLYLLIRGLWHQSSDTDSRGNESAERRTAPPGGSSLQSLRKSAYSTSYPALEQW